MPSTARATKNKAQSRAPSCSPLNISFQIYHPEPYRGKEEQFLTAARPQLSKARLQKAAGTGLQGREQGCVQPQGTERSPTSPCAPCCAGAASCSAFPQLWAWHRAQHHLPTACLPQNLFPSSFQPADGRAKGHTESYFFPRVGTQPSFYSFSWLGFNSNRFYYYALLP